MSQQIRRLHWGCEYNTPEGWINSDIKEGPGIDLPCDILQGLPLDDASIDYAVSIHALREIRLHDQVPEPDLSSCRVHGMDEAVAGVAEIDCNYAQHQRAA